MISEGGAAYDGTGYFKFAIVNAAGDTTYWSNDDSSTGGGEPSHYITLPVNDGYFMVLLGDTGLTNMTALPASVFSGTERYLRIWFSGDGGTATLLSPDQTFSAVPYALQAEDAATLGGLDSTAFYTKAQVDALLVDLNDRISDMETLLASVSLENGGNDVVFTDVNVHIRSGSGATNGTVNGRGNLIVGYNEDPGSDAVRGGSHNLVVGPDHSYPSYGGFVAGQSNTISGIYASVSGGMHNIASGEGASIQGGGGDHVEYGNFAIGIYSSVSGGRGNEAIGNYSSILGGQVNDASGLESTVSGGSFNEAGGWASSVSGGQSRVVSGNYNWRAGELFQDH
jgi:hypothetical protein